MKTVPLTFPEPSNWLSVLWLLFLGLLSPSAPAQAWAGMNTKIMCFTGARNFSDQANLMSSWIPSLEGVRAKLEAGAKVADVGCGKGASTLLMPKSFPKSQFFGLGYHDKSIEGARASAVGQGLMNRALFGVTNAKEFPGKDYDLVTVFDCLHDMGDPVGAATHVRRALSDDGT